MEDSAIKDKTPISESLEEIEQYMKENAGLGKSFDLGVTKAKCFRVKVFIFIM